MAWLVPTHFVGRHHRAPKSQVANAGLDSFEQKIRRYIRPLFLFNTFINKAGHFKDGLFYLYLLLNTYPTRVSPHHHIGQAVNPNSTAAWPPGSC